MVSRRTPPRVTSETEIGTDVDLDCEEVRLSSGKRLTTNLAYEIVEDVRRAGGRPSLSGEAAHSPRIAFRVTLETRERAAKIAAAEGKTVSQLAREALEARLAG
jgi:predicted HicB family RNase H-like nuclease